MSSVLDKYRNMQLELPETNLAWRMYEAGVENFGKTGVPDELPLVRPKENEVLLRVDAIGICFSDVKLITQGASHPRITGRDLVENPVTAGHEVSLTVVEAGENYKDKYKPGQRFIVQADIYYKGVNLAYGYALPGGMQQYGIVGEEVLNGDEGSYLIPINDPETGYAEAALVEPWTCVVAAYRIYPRRNFRPDGALLIAQYEDGDYKLDDSLTVKGCPAKIVLAGVDKNVTTKVQSLCPNAEIVQIGKLAQSEVKPLSQERTGDKGFDDIVVLGTPDADTLEAIAQITAHEAVMAMVTSTPVSRPLQIDVGRVHYDYIDYIGTQSGDVAEAYRKSRDSEFSENGTAWFIGAAGPMGQMHVQRAVKRPNGPKKILCTDVDNSRLQYLKESVTQAAKENGIEMVFLNPTEAGQDGQEKAIRQMTGGKGFDDIIVLAPVAALITASIKHLAEGGLMNIFAGVPRGTISTIDLSVAFQKGNRFVGSSGSRPKDMIDTLKFTEDGELPTENSLASIGGIDAMAAGLRAVKEAIFPGKTVIFPHIELPLTALVDLKDVLPEVYEKLTDGKFWNKEAEHALLESKLRK